MSMIWASTSLKLFSITGVELLLQEEVSLDAELIFKEMDRRLGIIPYFNFSIAISWVIVSEHVDYEVRGFPSTLWPVCCS